MGRFSKLDLEGAPKAAAPKADAWPDMDDAECLKQGHARFWTGYPEDALTLYSRALRFNRDLEAAWIGQIRCLLILGEYPEATTWSDRAMERFRDSSDLLACKGLALTRGGDADTGTEYLDGAVQRRAPSAWAWTARGVGLLLREQPHANAERCFLKASEQAPNDWRISVDIANAWNEARAFARARAALRPLTMAAGEEPLFWCAFATACEGLGEFDAASGFYQRAIAARGRFPLAEAGLERVQSRGPLAKLRRKFGK